MSRARVLLVNPTMTARRHARFPLSLLALAERLSKTHAVTLIDGNVDRDALPRIRSALSAGPHAAVGVTVMGGPQVATAIDASQLVRQIAPTTPVVWGGYFPSLYPDTALNASYVDYAVRGPGEETMAELLAALWPAGRRPRRHRGAVVPCRRLRRPQPGPAGDEARGVDDRESFAARRPESLPRAYRARCAHGRAPGGGWLPLPVHVLRCRGDVPGYHAPAVGGAARARSGTAEATLRRRLRAVLRPQLLRPRAGHAAAARGAREGRAAVVVLCASRCTHRPLARGVVARAPQPPQDGLHRGRVAERPAAARDPQGHPGRPDPRGRRALSPARRDPRAVLHGGPAGRPGGRDRADLRVHPRGQAGEPGGRDHRLRLHAAPHREPAGATARARRGAAGRRRTAIALSGDTRGVDGAPLGRLRVPRGCAVAQRPAAPAHPRLRDGSELPVPDRAGRADAGLGGWRAARGRRLALPAAAL